MQSVILYNWSLAFLLLTILKPNVGRSTHLGTRETILTRETSVTRGSLKTKTKIHSADVITPVQFCYCTNFLKQWESIQTNSS